MKLSYYIYYRVPAENAKRARATVDVIQKDLSDMTGISGRLLRRRDDETTWMEIYENVASAERFEAERARRFLGRPPARARRAGSRSRGQLAWNNAAGALRRADELPQPGRQKTERPVARRPRERISYRQGGAGGIHAESGKARRRLQRLQPCCRGRRVDVFFLQPRRAGDARRARRSRPVEPPARYALAEGRESQGRGCEGAFQGVRCLGDVSAPRRHRASAER